MTAGVELVPEALDAPRVARLVEQMVAEMQVRYDDAGAGGVPLDPADFAPPRGAFLLALRDGEPVACGGLRPHAPGVGEVKRMYVVPGVRRQGLALVVLGALEEAARGLGWTRLLLETGTRQPEALALYERAGWRRVPPYGEWRESPLSVCFGRDL